ncbi:hypothetical protein PR048_024339 [Dryococelus australis]|uniref:Uncharacterized protein n=1 Tax=Dryococelus australis TaxID=614101 RepID=A0ABQ9GNB8_9NEOP|nr:hypothetical protein PR048_024339 [Dryococelus australis]
MAEAWFLPSLSRPGISANRQRGESFAANDGSKSKMCVVVPARDSVSLLPCGDLDCPSGLRKGGGGVVEGRFSDLQAGLFSPLRNGDSAVCPLAVAPHLAVMGFARCFLASLLLAQRRAGRLPACLEHFSALESKRRRSDKGDNATKRKVLNWGVQFYRHIDSTYEIFSGRRLLQTGRASPNTGKREPPLPTRKLSVTEWQTAFFPVVTPAPGRQELGMLSVVTPQHPRNSTQGGTSPWTYAEFPLHTGCETFRWSAGFLGYLPFPSLLHFGAASYSRQLHPHRLSRPRYGPPETLHSYKKYEYTVDFNVISSLSVAIGRCLLEKAFFIFDRATQSFATLARLLRDSCAVNTCQQAIQPIKGQRFFAKTVLITTLAAGVVSAFDHDTQESITTTLNLRDLCENSQHEPENVQPIKENWTILQCFELYLVSKSCREISLPLTICNTNVYRLVNYAENSNHHGAAVAEWLACSPPTKTPRIQSPAGSLPDFCMWELCWTMLLVGWFSGGYPVPPRRFIPALLYSSLNHRRRFSRPRC